MDREDRTSTTIRSDRTVAEASKSCLQGTGRDVPAITPQTGDPGPIRPAQLRLKYNHTTDVGIRLCSRGPPRFASAKRVHFCPVPRSRDRRRVAVSRIEILAPLIASEAICAAASSQLAQAASSPASVSGKSQEKARPPEVLAASLRTERPRRRIEKRPTLTENFAT